MSIEVRNLTKKFGPFTALDKMNLTVPSGELVALLGPSGSGKTTLLRIIAGLEFESEGSVLFDGEDTKNRDVRDRRVGFVFQHYALFKHMTVFDNVAFGLQVRPRAFRPSAPEIRERVEKLLHLVQLEWMAGHFPSQLSGGQRQRIALARALAVEPQVLLLDEPFGSLDAKVRKELRQWLRRLHDEIHITSLFVTHDQEEALEVADRVVVINEGRIIQVGTPQEIYHHPASPFVYNFLGNVNLFRGRVEDGKAYIGNMMLELSHPSQHDRESSAVFVRPHVLDIHKKPQDSNYFEARVLHVSPAGPLVKVELISEWGDPVQVEILHEKYRELDLKKDDLVYVSPQTGALPRGQKQEKAGAPEIKTSLPARGTTLWLTGLPKAGKSTIAYLLKKKLMAKGVSVELLDGDVIRTVLSEGLGFSKLDRDANIRRISFVCQLLTRNGVVAIVAAVSPYREAREQVRRSTGNFVEIYVKCPLHECEARDSKGLYQRARDGEIKGLTGVDDPYEEPLAPEVICETDRETPEESVAKILDYLNENSKNGTRYRNDT